MARCSRPGPWLTANGRGLGEGQPTPIRRRASRNGGPLLLLYHGLPLWRADLGLNFSNRPSKFLSWPSGPEIRTNRYGQHDHEFAEKPAPGELRILAVGDSVTFGELVNRDEAFPNQLEQILADRNPGRPQSAQRFALRPREDPKVAPNYGYVLDNLEMIYELGRESGVRVLLVLSPYTFQFSNESSLIPQQVLTGHALKHGIEVPDLYDAFAARLRVGQENPYLQDASHFTPNGHRIVAAAIARDLEKGFGTGGTLPNE